MAAKPKGFKSVLFCINKLSSMHILIGRYLLEDRSIDDVTANCFTLNK